MEDRQEHRNAETARAGALLGTDVEITCRDGYQLTARHFAPPPHRNRGTTAIIAPATGAKASYYWRYASYLASVEFSVVVADYRGVGRSAPQGAPRTLKGLHVRWHHWGTLDLDAVIGWAQQNNSPEGRMVVVGHSFGGLAACLAPRAPAISRLLMVGTQHAHWPDYARDRRLQMLWRWHLAMPIITAAYGYFPGRQLGWLEDLPRGVAFDWAKGYRNFACTIGRRDADALARCAGLTFEILAVAPTDDEFATATDVHRALAYLPRADVRICFIDPATVGTDQIGHLGLFNDRFRNSLWPRSANWLSAGWRPLNTS